MDIIAQYGCLLFLVKEKVIFQCSQCGGFFTCLVVQPTSRKGMTSMYHYSSFGAISGYYLPVQPDVN